MQEGVLRAEALRRPTRRTCDRNAAPEQRTRLEASRKASRKASPQAPWNERESGEFGPRVGVGIGAGAGVGGAAAGGGVPASLEVPASQEALPEALPGEALRAEGLGRPTRRTCDRSAAPEQRTRLEASRQAPLNEGEPTYIHPAK